MSMKHDKPKKEKEETTLKMHHAPKRPEMPKKHMPRGK